MSEVIENQDVPEDAKFVFDLLDLLPTEEELTKFAIILKNYESMVSVYMSEESEKRLEDLSKLADALDVDVDILIQSLMMSALFYQATQEVDIDEVV